MYIKYQLKLLTKNANKNVKSKNILALTCSLIDETGSGGLERQENEGVDVNVSKIKCK